MAVHDFLTVSLTMSDNLSDNPSDNMMGWRCRAFFRVFAFHILWFQLLASLAWSHGDWFVASLTLLTHALLSLLEQLARWYTQRAPGASP